MVASLQIIVYSFPVAFLYLPEKTIEDKKDYPSWVRMGRGSDEFLQALKQSRIDITDHPTNRPCDRPTDQHAVL